MAATATAQTTKPGKLISSRFTGTKCSAGDSCMGSGAISRGDLIRWIAGNRFSKALTYHDICFDALWDQGKISARDSGQGSSASGTNGNREEESGANRTSGNGGSSSYQGNGVSGFELQAQETQGQFSMNGSSEAQGSSGSNNGANASWRPSGSSARNGSGAIWSMFADEIAPFLDERRLSLTLCYARYPEHSTQPMDPQKVKRQLGLGGMDVLLPRLLRSDEISDPVAWVNSQVAKYSTVQQEA